MLDVEKYRKQVDRLKDCVNNLESASERHRNLLSSDRAEIYDIYEADEQVERCRGALIGQLKLMNMQNENELK